MVAIVAVVVVVVVYVCVSHSKCLCRVRYPSTPYDDLVDDEYPTFQFEIDCQKPPPLPARKEGDALDNEEREPFVRVLWMGSESVGCVICLLE